MADPESQVSIPSNRLRYYCSNCKDEFPSYFGTQQHFKLNASCKDTDAKVEVRTAASTIANVVAESEADERLTELDDDEDEPKISMAEAAASASSPPWAGRAGLIQFPDDEDDDEPERDAPRMEMRGLGAGYQVQPEPWLLAAYQAARRDEYMNSFSDWVHDEIAYLFMIQGIKVELLSVRPEVRQEALKKAGLADAARS